MKKTIIAIDPGQSGAVAVIMKNGLLETFDMPETPKDVLELLAGIAMYDDYNPSVCYLEKVHSMPGQGVSSSFKFGRGYGNLEMALIALKIPTVSVDPTKWMKELALGTRGDRTKTEWKNHLKKTAQQLFPDHKFTLANCDAALICSYGNRLENK